MYFLSALLPVCVDVMVMSSELVSIYTHLILNYKYILLSDDLNRCSGW